MLRITGKKPLAYEHPLSHLITALPYIDESNVPRSVVNYLVKTEAAEIGKPLSDYIKDFKLPETPFMNSPQFEQMVREAESRQKKSTKQLEIPNVEGASAIVLRSTIDHGYRNREYNYLRRTTNLDITQKLGPVILKEHISCLDKLKQTLQLRISEQQREIEQINAKRKYQQLECKERLETIHDRVKMLLVANRQYQ